MNYMNYLPQNNKLKRKWQLIDLIPNIEAITDNNDNFNSYY